MKCVLITGGSRGIGRAMVELFSSEGYNVAFTYKSSDSAARELSDKCGALAIKADSSNSIMIEAAVKRVEEVFGGVDVLINNAAVCQSGLITELSTSDWERLFSVNMTSVFLYSKLVLPKMLNKKWGRIINIGSMWGTVGASCEVAYSASKAAVEGFTKALAKEVGPSGITVNAIAPGVIDTDMNSSYTEEDIASLCDMTPVCRIGKPVEIAEAALFLASDKSAFITGEIMNISGGFVV